MRVLLCNKYYYRRGGDCVYTMNLERLLASHGHETAVFAMDCAETVPNEWRRYFAPEVSFESFRGKFKYLLRTLGLDDVASRFSRLLEDFRPDVVHLNNIHSQLSPILAVEAGKRGIRVVWTLHDYKLLCPRYDCLRNGKTVCEECFGNKTSVLKYSCMKNSFSASALAFAEAERWNRKKLSALTDVFICPSRFMLEKMSAGGFPGEKLVHLCNFIDVGLCRRDDYSDRGDYFCYVGRLSGEKGIPTLLQAVRDLPYKLVVVGGGPLQDSLPAMPNVEYAGHKDWQALKEIVGRARFSVIPSEWYENNPLSVIEALCLGTPVLGARIGGIPELIDEGRSGMCFTSGDAASLRLGIESMFNTVFDYGRIAHDSQERFSSGEYYRKLMDCYR